METIMDSKTSEKSTSLEPMSAAKAASAPLIPQKPDDAKVKTQLSAPSYFYSLKENEAPPFRMPGKEPRPRLLIGTIMNEEEAVEMIAAADKNREIGLRKFLGEFLISKNVLINHHLSEKRFLTSLLAEVLNYAAQRDFSAHKLACLITIYVTTHLYFKWYYWLSPVAVWNYFKEIMIRHTIEDSPDGQDVFEPEECYDILSHFHTVYLSNLPLIHILTFGTYRLKLIWPFRPKEKS